jgi:uncharacterized repeat protein (TIGR02543 family)
MKVGAARSKIASIISAILLTSLFVSIPVPASANNCVPTTTTASNGETILTFSTVGNCNWTVPTGVTSVRVLVVGAGSSGSAGQASFWWPQGGAGGAVVENQSFTVTPGAAISIAVGVGGAAVAAHSNPGNNGGQSSFATITANGGTAPVFSLAPGGTSGNGNPGGASTGQYVSGGGGGAGGAGDGTTGGIGVNSNISGTRFMYGSGGAGSNGSTGSAFEGGGSNGNPPTANGGGGGSQTASGVGAASAGADGVVIVRYATSCNPTSISVGTDTVLTFANLGSCRWRVPDGVANIWVVAVGGGGAAGVGVSNQWWGAGGGGGQVTSQTISANSGDLLSVSVGAGGATGDGAATSFGSLTASGGKTPLNTTAVGGVSGSGMAGGTGGTNKAGNGGGGAWKAASAINAGEGISSSITGTAVEYGGGGNGYNAGTTAAVARPGAGSYGVEALANRGGGGSQMPSGRGAGGSGVVIIRYAAPAACAPTSTAIGTDTVLRFATTGTCTWSAPANISTFQLLVVGAGGGGGSNLGGGGGGGRVISQNNVTISQTATITVGAGGAGGVGNFGDTTNHGKTGGRSAVISGSVNVVSLGGSGGNGRMSATNLNSDGTAISSGYTGGGGAYENPPAHIPVAGSGGAGFIGGRGSFNGGGGGGGAGGPGVARGDGSLSNASSGGIGVSDSITGTPTFYGGGGGAAWYGGPGGWTGIGGAGGGGQGANGTGGGADGTANTGGGGGAGYVNTGGNGGTGIVIIRYGIPDGFSALSFNANGGTGSRAAMFAATGSSVTVPDGTGFANQGFEFNGWYTNATGTGGTAYAVSDSIVLSSNTTLFARWTRAPAPNCAAGVGQGGPGTSNFTTTKAGNGCVGISYKVGDVTTVATFNYTGADQSWTVPTGVTSATFYLIGAGGGGGIRAGGGGGYVSGTYSSLTPGQTLTVIVGQGGGGVASTTRPGVSGYPGQYTPTTYGGGGRGGSYGGASANWFASGGGRSAIRLPNATEIATAAGGGGGAYGQCGFGGGGTSGLPTTASGNSGTGGTQTAGGTGGISNNGYPGTVGAAFQGGDSRDEGGGGGGGYFGGGGGGDNAGGPGGSSYIALLTGATTTAGANCGNAAVTTGLVYVVSYNANTATSGSAPSNSTVTVSGGTLTLASNSGTLAKTNFTFSGWNTAADGSGTTYAEGATTLQPAADTTLFAQWNSTISYNANGAAQTAPTAVVTKGSGSATFNLNSGSGLTRTGLNFVGWNTRADGNGVNYAGGASYTSAGTATLFAIFRPTYTYNANGATGGTVPDPTVGSAPGTACIVDPGYTNCKVFSYTGGNQTFTAPTDIDVTKGVLVEAWGAGGGGTFVYYGDPSGGAGGYSKAKINTVTAGDVFTVIVGQGGLVRDTTNKFGGGGAAGAASGANLGSSGGGYSGIFSGSGTSTPILISGGGGGGSPGTDGTGTPGGGGGANQSGGQSTAANATLAGGRGGTTSAGGAGGTSNNCTTAGSSLQGGNGCAITGAEGGGGGGGGYFGGGGGAYQTSTSGINGGGGGGSGFLNTTLATLIAAVKGPDGVFGNFAFSDRTSPNYTLNAGRGGMPNTNTAADNTGGNGLITIQWSSPTVESPVSANTGNLVRTGYRFAGWNTAANGNGTSVAPGAAFPSTVSATLFAAWEPDNSGLTPSFNTNTTSPIGVLANTAYVINNVYADNANDLVLSQYADRIQIIATVPSGTLAITTTTNLTLPVGYQSALNTAAGTISFVGNLAAINAALATLKYTAAATAVSTTITITASYAGINGDYRYNAATGNYYWRGGTPVVRQAALDPTTASNNCGVKFNGMCGYMTIPNNAAESLYIVQKLGIGWIGITKPNHPTLVYVANAPSAAPFTFWSSGEGGLSNEPNIGIRFSDGKWADLSTQTENPIYEFGGKGETPIFGVLTRTITIGALATTGTPTLDSASDTGTSSTDKITRDNTPTVNIGGLTVGATITLTATPASGPAVTCTFVATTTTSSCTFPTMNDGTYSITARQSLGGATTAASTALSNVVIDATRPTVTLTSSQIVSGGNRTATQAAPAVTNQITITFSETISGLLISEITKNIESTGWVITQTAFTTAPFSSNVFTVTNANGAGGVPGIIRLSVLEGVASDVAGNTNTATANDFVINTLIQLTLTNEYDPCCIIGGNNELIAQTTPGGAITLPGQGTLTRAGHTFAGWSLSRTGGNGTVLGATFTPTVPAKLFSSWIPQVYVVTYNANGGNGAATVATQNYTFGAPNLALTTKGTLTRTGFTFAGWNTLATGLGTNYLESASYKPTASIILYAKWTANSYTLTYNANGGSTSSTAVITAGTPLTLSTTAGTRAGFTLAGWNTAADGSGSSFAGATSQTYFSNITLFALWRPVVPGAPTVSAATAGNTTATATVTPVAASGTTVGPAASFTVQAFDSTGTTAIVGKTCTVLASATPLSCVITGLTNGTTYKFKATATNATGSATGAASTVTATPAPFVVTYSPNGGTVTPATANFNLGSPLTLPLPTRLGFTFTGWNNPSSASVGIDGASYSPPATITLTAQWSANTYTITYSGNGSNAGTVPSQGSFSFGNSYSILTKGTMSKTGYDFAGWTTASNGTGTLYAHATDVIASSAATYAAASNLTVYAKWTPQVYVITYNANGATGSPARATDSFTFGGAPISLPDKTGMTYSGYTFVGWSETTSGVAVVNPYSPTQARILYAIWAGISYSISYNVNGGAGSVADATYTTGAAGITLNNGSTLSRVGYVFSGWKNLAGTTVSTSAYAPTDNVTVYAIWTPKPIAVTYDKGIATTTTAFPSATTVDFGANLTLSSAVDVSTSISSTNYLFAGWEINGVTYKSGDTYRVSSEAPITVTAQWLRLFDVRYNVNGGTLAANDLVTDGECVTAGLCTDTQVITLNDAPTRSGFTFNGWNNQGGTLVADSDPALAGIQTGLSDANYIFYASWTANSYTITFAAGAGSNGNAAAITDSHGAVVQLAPSAGYSLAGSIFTGWLIDGVTYPAGAFYTMGTNASPITATAQYANNTFKVFYNTNGATTGVTPTPTSAVQGANISYNDATGFGRAGFTFEGWSDGTTVRAAGFATTMGSANATVIAQWKIALPVTPTITAVTGSDGGATITVAAAATGGAPSSYLVTASPGGATCTVIAPATSCSISPLANGTPYTFSVTASNSTGTSAAAISGSVTPAGAPDAPTGLNAVRGNTEATVSFTPVTGSATGGPAISTYTITAYDANNNAVGTPCQASSSATSCVVTGLTNGTPYTFKATANNGLFTSSASAASSAVIPATVPDAPTAVSASVTTAGAATVSFTAPSNNGGIPLTGFTVTSSPGGFTCTAAANATSCVVSGLTNGTAYTFTVIATNEIGNSVATSATSAVTPQSAASAPTVITATPGDAQSTVAFSGAATNGSTIANYTVQAYDSNGNAVPGATCTTATSPCTVPGLSNGSTYTFKVVTNSTVYGAGTTTASLDSISSNPVTPATVPSAPTNVEVTPGTGQVTVSWNEAVSNGSPVTSYQVQAFDSDGNPVTGAICTANAPDTTCDVSTNLAVGSNYTFKVTAMSAAGSSLASSASTAVAVNAVPSVPLSVVAVAGNTSATVTWGTPANANGSVITGYEITAYDANNNAAGTCTSVAPQTTCDVTGLTNGTPYTFKATATNAIGTSLESLASTAVTPSTIPNAPTGVTAAMGDEQATVSFLAPTNNGGAAILSYTVTSSPGNFTCTVNAPATSCNITGLTNGTAYTFTVKASNKNGDSNSSTASPAGTPVQSSAPTLANPGQPTGNPYVGSILTSNVSFNGSPTPTTTYQWKSCDDPADLGSCTDISGATSATYTPTISELGKYIVVEATAINRVDTLTETSNPTLVINPEIAFTAPSPIPGATTGTAYVLSLAAAGGVGTFTYVVSSGGLPAGISLDTVTGQLSGTPTSVGTFTFTVRATDSNGVFKEVVVTITVTAQVIVPTCDAACVAATEAQAAAEKAAADKAAADALAKAIADRAAADRAAAAKRISDAAAIAASTKAAADAAAATAAAKAAVDRAAAAALAQAAADAAAQAAAAQAKAAADAQAIAIKAAADAAAALRKSTTTAVAKAAATAAATKAARDAATAVAAAANTAKRAAAAKAVATNATKQVDIAINSLNSRTAASQASAQANAIAAAAKAAADAAAKAAADDAARARATAAAAQKAASDSAARIAIEQKQAADAAARSKIAAEAAAKATAEKTAAIEAARLAAEAALKILNEKAALAEQAAKATTEAARAEINKKIEEVAIKVEEAQKVAESASAEADTAVSAQEAAVQVAEDASMEAQTQAAKAEAVKVESATRTAVATRASAAATVATNVATAARAAAARVPARAVIAKKPSTSTNRNSATATISGLKPGQKVKVTVNVKGK